MAFIGFLLCLVAVFVIGVRFWYMVTGKVVEGRIVGYDSGPKMQYGQRGHNYRIRLEYQDEIYYVTSLESTITSIYEIPRKNLGLYCNVYFRPKAPKRVVIRDFHHMEWIAFFMFALGAFVIGLSI